MGVTDPDLIDLMGHMEDARQAIRRARDTAALLVGSAYHPDRDEPGWPAMECLVVELDGLRGKLEALPGPEIAAATAAELYSQDEMGDRADGQSY